MNNVYYYEICCKELLDGYNYWIFYIIRKSLNKKKEKVYWLIKIRLILIDGFIYIVIDGCVVKCYFYLYFYLKDVVGMMIERKKKKVLFLKKRLIYI